MNKQLNTIFTLLFHKKTKFNRNIYNAWVIKITLTHMSFNLLNKKIKR
jgi:hypothetical protein